MSLPEPMRAMVLSAGLPTDRHPTHAPVSSTSTQPWPSLSYQWPAAAPRWATASEAAFTAPLPPNWATASEAAFMAPLRPNDMYAWSTALHPVLAPVAPRTHTGPPSRPPQAPQEPPAWAVDISTASLNAPSAAGHADNAAMPALIGAHRAPIQRDVSLLGASMLDGNASANTQAATHDGDAFDLDLDMDLDRLVEDVYHHLRWRLVAERERSGSWF